MKPTKKLPLFIVSGASGVGKSALCEVLFQKEEHYIVMESDLVWSAFYDTPENNYHLFRKTWLGICASISQIGLPVVLCGCVTPEQFETLPERELFSDIHYLAAVCERSCIESRMRDGRRIDDESHIKSSLDFNDWLKANAHTTSPNITLLDTTNLSPEQAAEETDRWIMDILRIR